MPIEFNILEIKTAFLISVLKLFTTCGAEPNKFILFLLIVTSSRRSMIPEMAFWIRYFLLRDEFLGLGLEELDLFKWRFLVELFFGKLFLGNVFDEFLTGFCSNSEFPSLTTENWMAGSKCFRSVTVERRQYVWLEVLSGIESNSVESSE